ncbi:alpha/beta hydrolase [Allopusillimonas ginsengisoli]|nr:alpha/beta hydrolase [Allopusillimonas ginsengisoli]
MTFRREGSGPAIILLHGFASSSGFWSDLSRRLCDRYDLIAIDWPGFGSAPPAPALETAAAFAQAVLALADSLGLDKFCVIGHSMSGFVVQELLAHHEHRLMAAVLYGAGLKVDASRRFESLDDTLSSLHRDGPATTADRIVRNWFASPQDSTYAMQVCLQAAQGMTGEGAAAALRAFFDSDYTGRLSHVRTPVLVILGEQERSHPPDSAIALSQALPNACLVMLPRCGHAAHLEEPGLFETALLEFMQSDVHPA